MNVQSSGQVYMKKNRFITCFHMYQTSKAGGYKNNVADQTTASIRARAAVE